MQQSLGIACKLNWRIKFFNRTRIRSFYLSQEKPCVSLLSEIAAVVFRLISLHLNLDMY